MFRKIIFISPNIVTRCFAVSLFGLKDNVNLSELASRCKVTFDLKSTDWQCEPVFAKKDFYKNSQNMKNYVNKMESVCMHLQTSLCNWIEQVDNKSKFYIDKWDRSDGMGGGISCVISDGALIEKGGINITRMNFHPTGAMLKTMKKKSLTNLDDKKKYSGRVVGISCVLHPINPHVPTIHFNFRYFEIDLDNGKTAWWFGGGADLTPYILDEDDAKHFHMELKKACDMFDKRYYVEYKKECDDYFVNTHRNNERRGVGGIFFDDFTGNSQENAFQFVKSCAESIIPAYVPLTIKHRDDDYTEDQREWQLLRRGRYVEFNLIHDRGTKFGLVTPNSRIESILVSLPKYAKWEYCHDHTKNKEHNKLMQVLLKPKDWI